MYFPSLTKKFFHKCYYQKYNIKFLKLLQNLKKKKSLCQFAGRIYYYYLSGIAVSEENALAAPSFAFWKQFLAPLNPLWFAVGNGAVVVDKLQRQGQIE
jgi:hypothetical protein